MKYQKGFKYWIKEAEFFETEIRGCRICTKFIDLYEDGKLHIKKGFASDGGTRVVETKKNIRGFFVHDGLFYLMKLGLLPLSNVKQAGNEMQKIHIEDGVWKWQAKIYNYFATKFGCKYANPKNKPKIYECP